MHLQNNQCLWFCLQVQQGFKVTVFQRWSLWKMRSEVLNSVSSGNTSWIDLYAEMCQIICHNFYVMLSSLAHWIWTHCLMSGVGQTCSWLCADSGKPRAWPSPRTMYMKLWVVILAQWNLWTKSFENRIPKATDVSASDYLDFTAGLS